MSQKIENKIITHSEEAFQQFDVLFQPKKKHTIKQLDTNLNRPDKIQQMIRQREMLSNIEENILRNNMNINDPETYYRKLLSSLFKDIVRKKRISIKSYESLSTKLDKIENILTEAFCSTFQKY
jgi:hypothetical protein